MAFRTKLLLADREYDAISCNYSFKRDIDEKGRPTSSVYGGTIKVVVESNDDTNIAARLMEQNKPISGSATFHRGNEPSVMKKLSWENGYITNFSETFDLTSEKPMQIYFEVSAEKITMDGETIDHKRPQ